MNKIVTSKENILKASREIASKDGLQSINMRNVAKHCGVAVGSIYNYFPSKADLIIATARGEVPQSVKDIEFDGYICNDGHYIRFDNVVLIDDIMSTAQIQKQMDVYKKYNGCSMYNGHDGEWCAFLDDELIIKHREMFQGTSKRPIGVIENFTAQDVKAISCCVLFENADDLWNAYHELEDEFTMIPYATGLIRMDVYNKGFTKGTACAYLYQKLGIDYENTYAFGDGVNDIEMFQLVKHGIAMGNAVQELKNIASDITKSVDDDGIAAAFVKHFQIGE